MNEEATIDEQLALEKLYKSVAHRIVSGDSKNNIVADLIKDGWGAEAASELVDNIEDTVEEYGKPSKEWGRNKSRQYIVPMIISAVFLVASIALFIYGIISPEFEYILPVGIFAFSFVTFFYALSKYLRYKK